MEKISKLFRQYKEIILYLFFGGCTTLVSIVVFWYFSCVLDLNEHPANIISWIIAVMFAFLTNRIWVFDAPTNNFKEFIKQMLSFYAGRLFTLLLEEIILLVFVTIMNLNEMVIKILAQFVVIILNYVISRLFIFGKKEADKKDCDNKKNDGE